ncbi:MAG: C-terminal binding protein [Chloroflexi bacterium]|nr:C-terminal binding protein [Chloroflexota bacterium]
MSRRPKVVIADCNFPDTEIERRELSAVDAEVVVGQAATEEATIEWCADADAIIVQYAPLTRRVLEQLPRVRVIVRYGIGLDNVDVPAATALGIWVVNVPGFCKEEVAAHALAMVLAFARKLLVLDRSVRAGRWETVDVMRPSARLSTQTLGLVGFGATARVLAPASRALGMRVLAVAPHATVETMAQYGVEKVTLERLLRESDFVSLHAPLTAETRRMINAETLGLMRPTAYLINTARGGLVDEDALIAALQGGRLAGAGLDVCAAEPLPMDSPLRGLPNVILTPHSGYYSDGSLAELQTRVAQEVVRVLRGERPLNAVNPSAGPRQVS